MSKTVLGVYNSSDEVIQAIEVFQNEGYSVKDFSIIANTADVSSYIEDETKVASQEVSATIQPQTEERQGFLASLFTPFEDRMYPENEGRSTYYSYLVAQGISEADALKYEEDINSGLILLLAEKGLENVSAADGISTEDFDRDRIGLADTFETDTQQSLELREEQLDVNKQRVQTGEVEVKKDVVEEQKTVNVPVTHEEVYVERRSVDKTDADTTTPMGMGDAEAIHVPIVEEKVEVTKKPVVAEELVIGKKQVTETQQVTENIKREEAKVTKEGDASVNETTTNSNRVDTDRF
ncbi:YsnF/AvaK domain-containing protein [Neobacillus niacini]|uniref:YsnF/AvaK domain-containing protein n=1 Tax=Neobacillus niacini TaxID=86668 RepID=UPI000691AB0F|nr:YsnF/AvaK domain-containing protein [Neobacillus niacini]MEC1525778.1 YsnF/AvaK domain-containing protein [Neobacillus niacini]